MSPLEGEAALHEIVARMRAADRTEIAALYGMDPLEGLRESVASAEQALICRADDGDLLCVWGVRRAPGVSWSGMPWMICTDGVERRPAEFLRASRFWFGRVTRHFERLANVVHDENAVTIRWLGWLGFRFDPPVEVRGARALPFWWQAPRREESKGA